MSFASVVSNMARGMNTSTFILLIILAFAANEACQVAWGHAKTYIR